MSASEEMNGSRENVQDCQECVKLKSLVEDMKVQMDQVDLVKQDWEREKSTNRRLKKELKYAEDAISKKDDKRKDLRVKLRDTEMKNEKLEHKYKLYKDLEKKYDQKKQLLDLNKDDLKLIRQEKSALELRVDQLEAELRDAKTAKGSNDLMEDTPELIEELKMSNQRITELEKAEQIKSEKLIAREARIDELNEVVRRRENDLENANDENAKLEETVGKLKKQLAELKAAVKSSDAQSEVAQVLNKMAKTSTSEMEFQAVRDELKATKLELEVKKTECTKLFEELKLKISQLGEKDRQYNCALVSLNQRNDQYQQLDAICTNLKRTQWDASAYSEEKRQLAVNQCVTLKEEVKQNERIVRILEKDLGLEKGKVKEMTKLVKEVDRIYRHGLAQLRSEPSQLKMLMQQATTDFWKGQGDIVAFLSRIQQFPMVDVDCQLTMESLLNQVVSQEEAETSAAAVGDCLMEVDMAVCSSGRSTPVNHFTSALSQRGKVVPVNCDCSMSFQVDSFALNELKNRVEELEKLLGEVCNDRDLLRNKMELDELNKAASSQNSHEADQKELVQLRSDLKRLTADVENKAKEINALRNSLVASEKKCQDTKESFTSRNANLKNKNKNYSADLAKMKEDYKRDTAEWEKGADDRKKQSVELAAAKSQCEALQKLLDEGKMTTQSGASVQEVKKLRDSAEALKMAWRKTSAQMEEIKTEARGYKLQLDALQGNSGAQQQGSSVELNNLRMANGGLQQELSSAQGRIVEMTKQIANMTKFNDTLKAETFEQRKINLEQKMMLAAQQKELVDLWNKWKKVVVENTNALNYTR